MNARLSLALASLLLLASETARADTAGDATAEELFQRAKAAMASGNTDAACPLYAESYRLDKVGGTLQNLAFCYETAKKYASAYARYRELLALSKAATPPRADRVQLAEEHIKTLLPMLSHVNVTPPSAAPKGLTVTADGVVYGEVAWSTGLLLDPGPHDITVNAPGYEPWTTKLTVEERKDSTLVIPRLTHEKAAAVQASPVDPHPTRTAGLVVAGSGLLVAAAGGVFVGLAAGAKNDCTGTGPQYDPTTHLCYKGTAAQETQHDDNARAGTYANVANVALPLGAALVGVGAYLFFRGPSESARSAWVAPTANGAAIGGAF